MIKKEAILLCGGFLKKRSEGISKGYKGKSARNRQQSGKKNIVTEYGKKIPRHLKGNKTFLEQSSIRRSKDYVCHWVMNIESSE